MRNSVVNKTYATPERVDIKLGGVNTKNKMHKKVGIYICEEEMLPDDKVICGFRARMRWIDDKTYSNSFRLLLFCKSMSSG